MVEVALIVLGLLMIADTVSTYIALRDSNGTLYESNPLLNWLMRVGGPYLWIIIKVVVSAGVLWLMFYAQLLGPVLLLILVYAYVVHSNIKFIKELK